MASRSKILALYKQMMKESKGFTNYNFREYAIRRVRDGFRENKAVTEAAQITELVKYAEENLATVKRQVLIGHLYQDDKMVLESMKK